MTTSTRTFRIVELDPDDPAALDASYEIHRAARAHDVPEVRGSADRLASATGWRPEIPLEQTVADAIDHWRARL